MRIYSIQVFYREKLIDVFEIEANSEIEAISKIKIPNPQLLVAPIPIKDYVSEARERILENLLSENYDNTEKPQV